MAERFQPAGFCWSGFLCLVLAVLKLTVEAHWSWWRVSLPFWAVLGHNILYITIGFVWLYFADDGAEEGAATIRQGYGGYGYQIAVLVCFVVFADNVLRRIEGQEETMVLWVSSGRWELIVVSVMLTLCNSRSGLRLWMPAIGEPTEGNDSQEFRPYSTGCYRIRRVF